MTVSNELIDSLLTDYKKPERVNMVCSSNYPGTDHERTLEVEIAEDIGRARKSWVPTCRKHPKWQEQEDVQRC
ncbi:MAG: hypothetical protein LM517_01685 [Nitrosomonas sp.]|nr:hypothetical protein [Nitrosomonas sp.]